ncbi:hypothetical protein [Pedobacter sp. R-06]|uniref:hypothetical protein n=1 Tax=Pedobacter sp. R-06 TaxID=3404051 RepID=UPI003CEF2460
MKKSRSEDQGVKFGAKEGACINGKRAYIFAEMPALASIIVFGSFVKYPVIIKANITIDKKNTARFKTSQSNFTKLKLGSRAIIELESYPSNEYGTLQGKLTTISDSLYHDSLIVGEISLDKHTMEKFMKKAKIKKACLVPLTLSLKKVRF